MKRMVVNADDYGLRPEIDQGILDCCREGIVSSVSVMTNVVGISAARALAETGAGRGVHVNLTYGPSAWDGRMLPRTLDEIPGRYDRERLRAEVLAQVERFLNAFGAPPTHLDTHKHVHVRHPVVLEVVIEAALELGIPVRSSDAEIRRRLLRAGVHTSDHFIGGVGAEPYWTEARVAAALRDAMPGVTELMCHPGCVCPPVEGLFYVAQRPTEREALMSSVVRDVAREAGVVFVSWRGVASGESS